MDRKPPRSPRSPRGIEKPNTNRPQRITQEFLRQAVGDAIRANAMSAQLGRRIEVMRPQIGQQLLTPQQQQTAQRNAQRQAAFQQNRGPYRSSGNQRGSFNAHEKRRFAHTQMSHHQQQLCAQQAGQMGQMRQFSETNVAQENGDIGMESIFRNKSDQHKIMDKQIYQQQDAQFQLEPQQSIAEKNIGEQNVALPAHNHFQVETVQINACNKNELVAATFEQLPAETETAETAEGETLPSTADDADN